MNRQGLQGGEVILTRPVLSSISLKGILFIEVFHYVILCTLMNVNIVTAQGPPGEGEAGSEASGLQPEQPQSLKCDEYVNFCVL